MSKSDLLRWIGNILLIIGYQTMLWGEFKYGLMIKVVGGLLTVPFAIKLKLFPPGFQFPVKELVASLNCEGGLHKPTFFYIIYTKSNLFIYE